MLTPIAYYSYFLCILYFFNQNICYSVFPARRTRVLLGFNYYTIFMIIVALEEDWTPIIGDESNKDVFRLESDIREHLFQ